MTQQDIYKELDFWKNYIQPYKNFKHKQYYIDFFPFSEITGHCLEIGCGGSPFVTYVDNPISNIDLSLVDPLINQIAELPRYDFLKNYHIFNCSLLNFSTLETYDYIICLNVLDHFPKYHTNFIDKIKSLLKPLGKLFLYYDIRKENKDDHYSIDHNIIYQHIHNNFSIVKESLAINPEHKDWSTVYMGYRAVLENKLDHK